MGHFRSILQEETKNIMHKKIKNVMQKTTADTCSNLYCNLLDASTGAAPSTKYKISSTFKRYQETVQQLVTL